MTGQITEKTITETNAKNILATCESLQETFNTAVNQHTWEFNRSTVFNLYVAINDLVTAAHNQGLIDHNLCGWVQPAYGWSKNIPSIDNDGQKLLYLKSSNIRSDNYAEIFNSTLNHIQKNATDVLAKNKGRAIYGSKHLPHWRLPVLAGE